MWWRGLPPRQRPQGAPPHHSHLPYPSMLLEIALGTGGAATVEQTGRKGNLRSSLMRRTPEARHNDGT
jgi:hypothetical protein